VDARVLHDALRFALDVARDGEIAEPPVPAPAGLRRLLSFRRLSNSAYTTIAEALEHDEDFRRRVAEAADEATVGRAGLLWLTRPEGWEAGFAEAVAAGPDDPAERAAEANRLRRERDGAQTAAARARAEADAAAEARDRLAEELAELRREVTDDRDALAALRDEVDRLGDERNRAVRELKDVEATLAETRHDLKVAREATIDAERELDRLRAERGGAAGPGSGGPGSGAPAEAGERAGRDEATGTTGTTEPVGQGGTVAAPAAPFDRDRVRAAIDGAAAAARDLAAFLGDAGAALADPPGGEVLPGEAQEAAGDPPGAGDRPGAAVPPSAGAGRGAGERRNRRHRRGRPRRRRPALPFGVVEDTERAHRALVADARNLLVVDGYNLARTLWPGCEPEEERRRTVALLEELHARTGIGVLVVFDGVDDAVAPVASRHIRVRFSPTGVTADDVIVDLAHDLPADQPVVVVSSDREVADGARDGGASVIGSADFAAVARR